MGHHGGRPKPTPLVHTPLRDREPLCEKTIRGTPTGEQVFCLCRVRSLGFQLLDQTDLTIDHLVDLGEVFPDKFRVRHPDCLADQFFPFSYCPNGRRETMLFTARWRAIIW